MNRSRRRLLRSGCFKGAMKDKLLLFLFLSVQTTKVCSVPYRPDANIKCLNTTTEYLNENIDLCCKRCPPGHKQEKECSETEETKCKPCRTGSYIETWNFSPNCLSCTKCKSTKGLLTAQVCTPTTNSKCVCQPGKYCGLGFNNPQCADCRNYTKCKPGYGVMQPGTLDSDVKCELCPPGTFSNESSHSEPCRPPSETPGTATVVTTSTAAEKLHSTVRDPSTPSQSEAVIASTAGSTISPENSNRVHVAVTAGVIGSLGFLFIVMILLCLYKKIWRKDSTSLHPKVDANGNCETTNGVAQNYLEESKMSSLTLTSPEQECLLEKGTAGSDQSQCSITSDTLPKADDYTGHEFISPLQPTAALNGSTSALSEPMTLLSNTEPVSPQASIPTQCSSQPTSPQIVSPVTNSPHVNVNITLHIRNGSCGSPSFKPTDLSQAECKLPFGKEEESVSVPQQEAGDLSKISILESLYSNT